jgi:hypothetical protein
MKKLKINKIATSTNPDKIFAKDLLRFRHYDAPKQCDISVAKVATSILAILNSNDIWFRQMGIFTDGRKQFAICLAFYLEDYVVEAGIFSSFIAHNQEKLGKALPFYDLTDYDADYINWQDISFLCWIFAEYQVSGKFIAPDQPAFLDMGYRIFDCMQDCMDDLDGTDYYDELFAIPDDIDFFELKYRLKYFGTITYLQGLLGYKKYNEEANKIVENKEYARKLDASSLSKILYAMEDDYFMYLRTQFSALDSIEWFAKAVRCSDAMRQRILGVSGRLTGEYLYVESTEKHYHLQHLHTKRSFLVNKTSVTLHENASKNRLIYTSLVPWGDEWWVSGVVTDSDCSDLELANTISRTSNFTSKFYDKESLDSIYVSHKEMEVSFLAFFGTRLVYCDNKRDFQYKMDSFYQYQRMEKSGGLDADFEERVRKYKEEKGLDTLPGLRDTGNQLAMYFNPITGIEVVDNLPKLIQQMKSEIALTPKEKADVFQGLFFDNSSSEITNYLLDTYPTKEVSYPFPLSKLDVLKDKEFWLRYYNPIYFNIKTPNIRFTDL